VHSFARIFSGCFYDTILNILRQRLGASMTPTSAQLDDAVKTAGKLLVRAAAEAPENVRFFQSVGRAMVLADEATSDGANGLAIRDAFRKHNIALGSAAMLAPVAALAGRVGRSSGGRGLLSGPAVQDLRKRLRAAPTERLVVRAQDIGGRRVMRATHMRQVSLGQLDKRLKGVLAYAPQPVLMEAVDKTVAILGGLPEGTAGDDEVRAFVETLLASDRIAFQGTAARTGIKSAAKRDTRLRLPTHAVYRVGAAKVLRRVRFAC
jgi:hypothetical protein